MEIKNKSISARKELLTFLVLIAGLILGGFLIWEASSIGLPLDVSAQSGCQDDADCDGVPDDDDDCPVEWGLPPSGCPDDADGDGIPANEDDCPESVGPPGPHPYNGCPIQGGEGGEGDGEYGAGQIQNPFTGSNTLIGFIEFILNNIVLPIGATVAVFFLVFAGFLFVTARGDEERLRLAKKTFLWTSVGIAVLLGSVAIANGIQATVCQIAPGTPGCQ